MRGTNIITINGRQYDALTGMPMKAGDSRDTAVAAKPAAVLAPQKPAKAATHPATGKIMSDIGPRPANHTVPPQKATNVTPQPAHKPAAHHVHQQTQRSQTLHRAALKRPTGQHATNAQKQSHPVQRSQAISKFSPSAAHHVSSHHVAAQPTPAITPKQTPQPQQTTHAVAKQPKNHAANLKGGELKEHLIKQQMQHLDDQKQAKHQPKKRAPRLASIMASVAALVLLGGYLTYLNLPSLSIRVAAAQAGVDASFPTYQPSGYSFAGPVAFSPGEVRVNFASNTNDYQFSLVQRSSSWDSQAVLDNYVVKESPQYATLQERGLTIYLMENKAAWVNGGVFYVIDGNAPLSSEQIQKIASSTL